MPLLSWMVALSAIFLSQSQSPRSYDVPRASGHVTIDGVLDEAGWMEAPWTEEFVDIRGGDLPPPPLRTRAKILWDDEHLYVGAEMEETHLWATLDERDAIVYREDDFEVFLDPGGDGLAYYEIEINALGTVLDLFLNRPYNEGGRARIGWSIPGLRAEVLLMGTLNDPSDQDRGWSVELAIPWADLVPPEVDVPGASAETPGSPPRPGESWRINFSRVDWPLEVVDGGYRKASEPSREDPHPEANWVWSPQGVINMHVPEQWGVVRFVADPQNSLITMLQISTDWNKEGSRTSTTGRHRPLTVR